MAGKSQAGKVVWEMALLPEFGGFELVKESSYM